MGVSINEILLRVAGDADPAERELAEFAAELKAFDQIEAEAEAQLDAKQLRTELKAIERELRDFDHTRVDADVAVDVGDAEFELRILQQQLAALDRDDIEIDVELRRQITGDIAALRARLAGLRSEFSALDRVVDQAEAGVGGFGNRMDDTRVSLGPFSASLRTIFALIGVLIPIVVSLATGLGAVVASAAAAAVGVGALGIAFGSLLVPAIALAVGLVRRFKEESGKAGTAAHGLSKAAGQMGKTFDAALGRGADAVFRGATGALNAMRPVVAGLKGEFTTFGQAVGQSLRTLGQEFSSPRWEAFFSQITQAAATATPILTGAFISLSRVLRNIASAAMPALMDAFRSLRSTFQGWEEGTSNAEKLRATIDGLVEHTRSWFNLFKQVGRVIGGFFKAAAGQGKGLVDTLAQGAKSLADWANSAQGIKQIRGFIAEMTPVLNGVLGLVASLVPLFIEWARLVGPLVAAALPLLTDLVEILTDVLAALNGLPGPIKAVVAAFLLFKGPIGILGTLGRLLGGGAILKVLGGLGRAAGSALPAIARLSPALLRFAGVAGTAYTAGTLLTRVIDDIDGVGLTLAQLRNASEKIVPAFAQVGAAASLLGVRLLSMRENFRNAGAAGAGFGKTLATAAVPALRALQQALNQGGNSIRRVGLRLMGEFAQGVRGGKNAAIQAGREVAFAASQGARNNVASSFRGIGQLATHLFSGGMSAAKSGAASAGRAIATAAKSSAQSAGRALSAVGKAAGGLFARGVQGTAGAAASAGRTIVSSASSAMQGAAAAASAAGAALGNNFAAGIKSSIGAVQAAAASIAAAARNMLPGSEPKDPRSPLRNLAAAGAAYVSNFTRGIRGAGPAAAAAMRSALAGGGKLGEIVKPRDIIGGLKAALRSIRGGLGNLRGLQGDLGSAIQRIFAEGRGGFGAGNIKSGDLAGSLTSGLPMEEWLRNLVGEIQGDIGGVLDQIGTNAALGGMSGVQIAGLGRGRATTHDNRVDVGGIQIVAPDTGGRPDIRLATAEMAAELRRLGRAR